MRARAGRRAGARGGGAPLGEALGGELDGRGLAALWELTRGNALFVREVVLHGLSSGGLRGEGEVWHWRDGPSGGMRLTDLARLGAPEIADRLLVSVRTVDNHLQRAYRKLGVSRREDLAGLLASAAE